jgi:hypothetical protein
MEMVYRYLFGDEECRHMVSKYIRTEPYGDSGCVTVHLCMHCGKEYRDE